MTTTTTTLTVQAYAGTTGGTDRQVTWDRALQVTLHTEEYATRAEAEAVLALFPKSYRLRVVTCGYIGDFNAEGRYVRPADTYSVQGEANLAADGANGGTNETGIKRYRAIVAKAEKLGIRVAWSATLASNAYATRADFEAALA